MSDKKPAAYIGPERRSGPFLSEEQIEEIAEKAAEKAIEKMTGDIYRAVGKSVLTKFLWVIGASTVGAWLWLKGKGVIP